MPKVLFLDIETAPILAHVWSIWQQNVSLQQVERDWFVMSWAAKWLDAKEVLYDDNRAEQNVHDDKRLLRGIWQLLDEADIIVTQNGKMFDEKKLRARFIQHGFQPPSSYRHIDTKQLASKHFGFTSNKLEYLADKLCGQKKSKHQKFPGFELWLECLRGNKEAWREMERYNKQDVIVLEQLYKKLSPWVKTVDFGVYAKEDARLCSCGSTSFWKNGYKWTDGGKYSRYRCKSCGKEQYGTTNLLPKPKRIARML